MKTATIIGEVGHSRHRSLTADEEVWQHGFVFAFSRMALAESLAGAKCGVEVQVKAGKAVQILVEGFPVAPARSEFREGDRTDG